MIFEHSSEGNVEIIMVIYGKRILGRETSNIKNLPPHIWHLHGSGAIMLPVRTIVKYKVRNKIKIRRLCRYM